MTLSSLICQGKAGVAWKLVISLFLVRVCKNDETCELLSNFNSGRVGCAGFCVPYFIWWTASHWRNNYSLPLVVLSLRGSSQVSKVEIRTLSMDDTDSISPEGCIIYSTDSVCLHLDRLPCFTEERNAADDQATQRQTTRILIRLRLFFDDLWIAGIKPGLYI